MNLKCLKKTFAVCLALLLSTPSVTPAAVQVDTQTHPDLLKTAFPGPWGRVEEQFEGRTGKPVVLIRDAHAVPEAQHHIRRLIEFLVREGNYGHIAVEGASGELDPFFLKSFPDKELLEDVLGEFHQRAELTGVVAAAILGEAAAFQGLEDWALYEKAYGFFLKALDSSGKILPLLEKQKKDLERRKKTFYPDELFRLDQAVESFYDGTLPLAGLLKIAAGLQPPPKESSLSLLLESIREEKGKREGLRERLKQTAAGLEKKIRSLPAGDSQRELSADFYGARQLWDTGRLPEAAWMARLTEISGRLGAGLPAWTEEEERLMSLERRMKNLEGTRLMADLEAYIASAKSKYLKTPGLLALDGETRIYRLLKKLSLLELSSGEWRELREKNQASLPFSSLWQPHLDFYRSAEDRDRIFTEKLLSLVRSDDGVVFVSGGFHTGAVADGLRAEDVSYIVVSPKIDALPETVPYEEHMRGDVSWKNYFEAAEGKVSLYDAFNRAVRDRLLEKGKREHGMDERRMLEHWETSLLELLRHHSPDGDSEAYLSLLNERRSAEFDELEKEWISNARRFVDTLERHQNRGTLSPKVIEELIPAAALSEGVKSAVLSRSLWLPAGFLREQFPRFSAASRPPRSELRTRDDGLYYTDTQGPFENHVYIDTSTRTAAHLSVRDMKAAESNSISIRGFSNVNEGFHFDVVGGSRLRIHILPSIRPASRQEGSTSWRGFEFDVKVENLDPSETEPDSFMLAFVLLHTGRFIRDFLRASEGVDPIAGKDIEELEESGETLFPRFKETAAADARHVTLENSIQGGRYKIQLELFFPEGTEFLPQESKWPSIQVLAPPGARSLEFAVRLVSTHPALSPYRLDELYSEEVVSFREVLEKRVETWEKSAFTSWGLLNYQDQIQEYKELLFRLKVSAFDFDLRRRIQLLEEEMRKYGVLAKDTPSFLQMSVEEPAVFNELPLFQLNTLDQMMMASRFLMSREVSLAGSWQYLTYFGRDSIISARVAAKFLRPEALANLLQSVLDRVNENGEVAHEEDPRRPKDSPKRLDYRMMDGEFMLPLLVRDFMEMPAGLDRQAQEAWAQSRRDFWRKQSASRVDGKKISNLDVLRSNVRFVMNTSNAGDPISLKRIDSSGKGDPTGNWRDALNSMARAAYPGDVNFEWVGSSVKAIPEMDGIFRRLGLGSIVAGVKKAGAVSLRKWDSVRQDFIVRFSGRKERIQRLADWYRYMLKRGGEETDFALALLSRAYERENETLRQGFYQEWRQRIKKISHASGLEKVDDIEVENLLASVPSILEKDPEFAETLNYFSLGQDLKRNNIEAVNGDFSTFAAFNRVFSPQELRLAVKPALTPVEHGGLRVEGVGILTANPALAAQWNENPVRFQDDEGPAEVWDMLGLKQYHGLVVWPAMVNKMIAGWLRQLDHLLDHKQLEDARALYAAIGLVRGDMDRWGSLKNQEVWEIRTDELSGRIYPSPYASHIESNFMQLWNAQTEIAVQLGLHRAAERMKELAGTEAGEYYQAAKENDERVRKEILEWLELEDASGRKSAGAEKAKKKKRSELREEHAEDLAGIALALSPLDEMRRLVSGEEKRQAVLTFERLTLEERVPLSLVRRILEESIHRTLSELRSEESLTTGVQLSPVYEDLIARKEKALLDYLERKSAEAGLISGPAAMAFKMSERHDRLERQDVVADYTEFFNRHLAGRVDRLLLSGAIDSDLTAPLEAGGFNISTRRRFRKVLLTGGQRYLLLLMSDDSLGESYADSIIPLGIRLRSRMNPRLASLARLAHVVFGYASAISGKDPRTDEEGRRELLEAMFIDAEAELLETYSLIVRGDDKGLVLDGTVIEILLEKEAADLIATMA